MGNILLYQFMVCHEQEGQLELLAPTPSRPQELFGNVRCKEGLYLHCETGRESYPDL